MSPAVKGSKIMASPMRMRTAAAHSAMGGETTGVVSSGPCPGVSCFCLPSFCRFCRWHQISVRFASGCQQLRMYCCPSFVVWQRSERLMELAHAGCALALLKLTPPVPCCPFSTSTERRLHHARLAVGYGISVPAGRRRHKNSVFGRFNLRWAFEGWNATRKGWLLLPRRKPVRQRCCGAVFQFRR